jgi:hypothetical protein
MTPPEKPPVDRTGWGPGPWDSEPDRLEFEAHGFPCLMQRGTSGGWCGYVAVPPGHPYHGKAWDELSSLSVHGGVTYADACHGAICHVPRPGQPEDVWWLGFDCAHAGDYSPLMARLMAGRLRPDGEVYRTAAYVQAEVEALAAQLAEVTPHG